LYKKAEAKISKYSSCTHIRELAYSVHDKLGDKEWAKELYKKAEDKAGNSYDFAKLAEIIRENLGDKKWAKLLDQKAKELEEDDD